jgi:hypothetical protein
VTAAIKLGDRRFWGTNGAVEFTVETMPAEAVTRFGEDDPLTQFLRERVECFYMGAIIGLDEAHRLGATAAQITTVLEAAITTMLSGTVLTDYGRQWVEGHARRPRSRTRMPRHRRADEAGFSVSRPRR